MYSWEESLDLLMWSFVVEPRPLPEGSSTRVSLSWLVVREKGRVREGRVRGRRRRRVVESIVWLRLSSGWLDV